MKQTNNFNLPNALYNAMKDDRALKDEHRISVSELINPPLIRSLTRKHFDEIEEDVSERLWALLGQSVHYILEQNSNEEHLETEKKVEIQIGNWILAGRIDVYDADLKSIEDYKVTSVWSFLGEKIEWERQLNVYAYMMREQGYEVNQLFINAILRDWQASRRDEDYPEIPFVRKEIPLWTFEEQERYILERLALFEQEPEICTDEERWKRGGEIALMQEGRKKAIRLFSSEEETKNITLVKGQYFEKRPIEYARCKSYCVARKFCSFNPYREEVKKWERLGM